MAGIGVFGKLPCFGDFIGAGLGSPTGRAFERWLQMSNDAMVHASVQLPDMVGFCFHAGGSDDCLIGLLCPSQDKVGRTFPLALFQHVPSMATWPAFGGFPTPSQPLFEMLAGVALESHASADALRAAVADLAPAQGLEAGCQEAVRELLGTDLHLLLDRMYPQGYAAAGLTVLRKACAKAAVGGPRQPLTVDVPVRSDVEMAFWLVAAHRALPAGFGPPSAVWNVAHQRMLVVLGTPESSTLLQMRPRATHHRLYPAGGDPQVEIRTPPHEAIEALVDRRPATAADAFEALLEDSA